MVVLLAVFLGQILFSPAASAADIAVAVEPAQPLVICENRTDGESLRSQFENLRKSLEAGFHDGLPAQLKAEIIMARRQSDELSLRVLDTHIENDQEMNQLLVKTIDHLEQFLTLLPKVANHAPQVRDQYIIPLSNISSLRAESKECTTVQVAQAQETAAPTAEVEKSDSQKFALLTDELNRLNSNLYNAQTVSAEKYLAYRTELQNMLGEYNRSKDLNLAARIKSLIPEMVNSMQQDVEAILPGFELSSKYQAIVGI